VSAFGSVLFIMIVVIIIMVVVIVDVVGCAMVRAS
jgi:hypothetical protein